MPRHVGQVDIEVWLQGIADSELSLKDYFAQHKVPFSETQYYRYKKRIAAGGIGTFEDQRVRGNHRTITTEVEGYLKGYLSSQVQTTLEEARAVVKERFNIEITVTGMSRCLKRLELARAAKPVEPKIERSYAACGGFELVAALACHISWPQMVCSIIRKRVKQIQRSEHWLANGPEDKRLGRDEQGHFTSKYNRHRQVRESRFASIETKRGDKNFRGMSVTAVGSPTIARKALALLSLPVLTSNGIIRSVNTPLGNALQNVCGYNYKQATLTKFMAELKYLGVAGQLLRRQVGFWRKFWEAHPLGKLELPLLCYYVDGNTKALWSKKHVKKNKVTMLGRVMGCLETLFVHDCFGQPIYFETYAGQAPMGEYILSLFKRIERSLQGPGSVLPVNRVIVMDGAANSVRTLRAFAAQDKYHYITSLDDNQWKPRKLRRQGRARRYQYGQATLRDCEIELKDSLETGYLVTSRAIKINWDYGKRTVLLTSLDPAVVSPGEVVKAYFDRWPHEELQFRSMKEVACLNRVAAYGKQEHEDEKVVQRQGQVREKIQVLKAALAKSLAAIAHEEAAIAGLVKKEQKLRAVSRIEKGRRIFLSAERQSEFEQVGRKIGKRERAITKIKEPEKDSFKKLHRLEKEWLRLQGKEKVYTIDVELDEIMTFFRTSLVNIYAYLSRLIFGKKAISMGGLVQSILHLPSLIEETVEKRTVTLEYSKKDHQTMENLQGALVKINQFDLKTLSGKILEFKIGDIDPHLNTKN